MLSDVFLLVASKEKLSFFRTWEMGKICAKIIFADKGARRLDLSGLPKLIIIIFWIIIYKCWNMVSFIKVLFEIVGKK